MTTGRSQRQQRRNGPSKTEAETAPMLEANDNKSNLYRMWLGAYGTIVYVWADDFETAFEEVVEWADDNAPGFLVDVTEADLKEAAEDLKVEWQPHWPDWDDQKFQKVLDHAEADLTVIGHTSLKHGRYIPSWEWGGDEIRSGAEYDVLTERLEDEWLLEDLNQMLREERAYAKKEGLDEIDVRLQVRRWGSDLDWDLHSGGADYDTDHRGDWGSGSVGPDDTDAELAELARDLIAQAREQHAQS